MASPQGPEVVFDIGVDPDDGRYVADARDYDIHAKAATMDELRTSVLDAVDNHFGDSLAQPARVRLLFPKDGLLAE